MEFTPADPTKPLRFALGTRVECNTGAWTAGTVVQTHYSEPHWPKGRIVPYQIRLDDGRFIFAPMDDDRVIREVPKTPIHDALNAGDFETLKSLLAPDSDECQFKDKPDGSGNPPIIHLLSSEIFEDWNDETMIQACTILKEGNCAMGTCNMQGNTILHCAAERGSVEVMALVIAWSKEEKYCMSLNEQNMEGSEYTEGEWSVIDGDRRYLTEEEIENRKSQPNFYNDTPLHLAIKEEHEDVAMLLITEGADVNIPDSDGDTPLVSAMDNQMWDVSELLIQKDADIQIKSKNLACQSLLHHYSSRGNMRALTMIVSSSTFDQKLLMEGRGPLQFTPLHMAARGGRDAACDYLIELGADVDCIDENGKKPSDLAKSNNKMKLAEKLLGMESNDMPELD